jgi:hypothetical protein
MVDSKPCCQGEYRFLKQVKGASTSLRCEILFMAVMAVMAVVAARTITRSRYSDSISDSLGGQVWIRSASSKVIFGFAPCPAGRSGLGSFRALQVSLGGRSGGSTILASGRTHCMRSSSSSKLGGSSKLWRR